MLLGELEGAVSLHVRQSQHSVQKEQRRTLQTDWWTICEVLFEEDARGLVRFALPAMGRFLRKYRVRGIDASSKTLALLCLAQTELDGAPQRNETNGIRQSSLFSVYAKQNCRRHCREAEKSSLAVRSARVRIATARMRSKRPAAKAGMERDAADLNIISDVTDVLAELDVDDEMKDWVIVGS